MRGKPLKLPRNWKSNISIYIFTSNHSTWFRVGWNVCPYLPGWFTSIEYQIGVSSWSATLPKWFFLRLYELFSFIDYRKRHKAPVTTSLHNYLYIGQTLNQPIFKLLVRSPNASCVAPNTPRASERGLWHIKVLSLLEECWMGWARNCVSLAWLQELVGRHLFLQAHKRKVARWPMGLSPQALAPLAGTLSSSWLNQSRKYQM